MNAHALDPTPEDINSAVNLSPTSFHYDPAWKCPACGRSQRECVYSGRAGDWRYHLTLHHDHGVPARFEPVVICHDCNQVDARLKNYFRKKRVKTPSADWSLSVEEIRSVITPTPHKKPHIDFDKALEIVLNITKQEQA